MPTVRNANWQLDELTMGHTGRGETVDRSSSGDPPASYYPRHLSAMSLSPSSSSSTTILVRSTLHPTHEPCQS